MKNILKPFILMSALLSITTLAWALPSLTPSNISTGPGIKIWNVKATSAPRQGSSTETKNGTVDVKNNNGTTETYKTTYKETSGTTFQDGEICHNFGPKCYCATTTYRFESGMTQWKFATPSNNTPVDCPSGVEPTGDPEIRKAITKPDVQSIKDKIKKDKAGKN